MYVSEDAGALPNQQRHLSIVSLQRSEQAKPTLMSSPKRFLGLLQPISADWVDPKLIIATPQACQSFARQLKSEAQDQHRL
jgi:hypothetical protein